MRGAMFSGIVECQSSIFNALSRSGAIEIHVKRPDLFIDLKTGDSISVNGVCLTIERLEQDSLVFCLASETLQVTGWEISSLIHASVNLERSLIYGSRVHGHLVTGHVDEVGEVVEIKHLGECALMTIKCTKRLKPYIWKKGSIAVNGVSLTINECSMKKNGCYFEVCIIPETLKRTNLGQMNVGKYLNVEVDNFARGLVANLSEV